MKALLLVSVLATGCNDYVFGTLRVHALSESGDNVQYPKPMISAILGPDVEDVLLSVSDGMMGEWTMNETKDNTRQALVTNGPLFLQFGQYYDLTEQRDFDLDYYTFGRVGVQPVTSSTMVTLQLDGLDPWTSTDQLEVFSLDASVELFNVERRSMTPPDDAATSASLVFDWAATGQGAPQTYDNVYLAQLVQRTSDGLTYSTVAKAVMTEMVNLFNGSPSTIPATLVDVPATTSFPLELAADDFSALAAQVNPSASFDHVLFAVSPKPGGTAIPRPLADSLPDVLLLDTQTSVAGTAMIGNPYPSTWSLVGEAIAQFGVSYTAPGASSSATLLSTIEVDHLQTDPNPYRPEIGPVQQPQIEKRSAFADRTGLGPTPLVTWKPPKLGKAAGGYRVTVWEIANMDGATTFKSIAEIVTSGEAMRIPPNLLMLGKAYAFEITAIAAAHDIEQQPLQLSVPNAYASVLTGTLAP